HQFLSRRRRRPLSRLRRRQYRLRGARRQFRCFAAICARSPARGGEPERRLELRVVAGRRHGDDRRPAGRRQGHRAAGRQRPRARARRAGVAALSRDAALIDKENHMGHHHQFDKGRLARIGPAMQAYVDRGVYAGVSVLAARGGEVAYAGSFGHRDREAKAPMAEDTILRLYSMTKPIVCTALMTLVEEARIRLFDPVAKYIPAFAGVKVLGLQGELAAPRRPMMVRDLLTHTSGLSYGFLEDSPVSRDYARCKLFNPRAPLAEAIDDLATLPLAFQPGERFHYSVGIDVAARLIEVVAGQPLGVFLRQRLLAPLKMNDTDFVVPEGKRSRIAAMYGRPDITLPGVTTRTAFEQ